MVERFDSWELLVGRPGKEGGVAVWAREKCLRVRLFTTCLEAAHEAFAYDANF